MKVQISLDDELMNKIDSVADANYMSRSGLISFACVQYLNSIEMMSAMKDMSNAMKMIAENNELDEETSKKLEDIERLCKTLKMI